MLNNVKKKVKKPKIFKYYIDYLNVSAIKRAFDRLSSDNIKH